MSQATEIRLTKALFVVILATVGLVGVEMLVSGFTLGTPTERLHQLDRARLRTERLAADSQLRAAGLEAVPTIDPHSKESR